jgi:hypothetical protein
LFEKLLFLAVGKSSDAPFPFLFSNNTLFLFACEQKKSISKAQKAAARGVFFVQGKLINAFCSRENKLKFKIKKLERKRAAQGGKAKNKKERASRRGNKEACFN